jgi:hypothetical protein
VHVLYGTPTGLASTNSQYWLQSSSGVIDSPEAGDRFGSALAIGDFLDGARLDLAIGVPYEDYSAIADSGAVHVLYGGFAGLSSAGSQYFTQNTSGIIDSVEAGDHFGASLAAGNVGGAPRGDLLIGAPDEDVSGSADAGALHVLQATLLSGLVTAGSQYWTQNSSGVIDSVEPGDRFGAAIAVADWGQGLPGDAAIGVGLEDSGAVNDSGAVHLLFGAGAGLASAASQYWTQNTAGIADAVEPGDRFGVALAR